MTVHLSTQSATVLERKAFLHWVMLFIKLYRNPVACLSGQSISRSSIMISATPVCCYLVMFGDGLLFWILVKVVWTTCHFKPRHFSAAPAHMVTAASTNTNTNIWLLICYWEACDRPVHVSQPTWTVLYLTEDVDVWAGFCDITSRLDAKTKR